MLEAQGTWIERLARAPLRVTTVAPAGIAARYAVAVLLTALALIVTRAVPALVMGAPFLVSVAAVLFSALLGGAGPALLSLALGTVGLATMLPAAAPPLDVSLAARLAAFWIVGVLVAAVGSGARRVLERERANARHERIAAARIARLQAATAAFADCGTVAEVADVALRLGVDAAGAAGGAVCLLSTAADALVLVARRGVTADVTPTSLALPRDGSDAAWEPLRRGAPVFLAAGEALEAAPLRAGEAAGPGQEAWAGLPLRTPRSVLGVLSMPFGARHRFDDEERAYLEALADGCAQALERARLAEGERAALERTRMLLDLAGSIADARDLPALLARITEEVGRRFEANAAIAFVTPDAGALRVEAMFHPDPALREALRRTTHGVTFGLDSRAGAVARTGRSLLIPRLPPGLAAQSTEPALAELLGRHPMTSYLVVPIRSEGEVIGTLSASRHDAAAPPFGDADRELLEELAARAGLAITSARRHEALLAERQRLSQVLAGAEAASRAKDEFLAMLSHELRNPLAPIATALHLMQLRDGDAFARERAIVERQVRHLTDLVDDLLDVSRITQGKVRLRRRVVPLAGIVSRAVEMASPLYEQREHALEVEVPPDLLVHADEQRLAQVISNLLVNAGKYTPRRGRVELRARRRDGRAVVEVKDDGIGIPPDLLPRIFEMFVQGERQSDRAPGGLGLGLTLVKSLVQLHGGTVAAHSEGPGKGSTFLVELPAAEPADEPAAPALTPLAVAALRPRRRILVVDDNRDAAELLAEALRDAGEVRVAFDGPGALSVLREFTPDVALLDLGLPVMDGFELARRIHAVAPAVRLVAVSGYGQEADRRRSAEAGFAEHLVKPVDLSRLRAAARGEPAPG